jgi:hypothetical protein
MPAAPVETYFHCTYAKNLAGIARRGLVPSPTPGLLRAVAKNHRGVYLTEPGGILFWFGRLENWAFNDSDDPLEDGLVPVVLKVTTACKLIEDELGTEHARARAAVCPRPIPPGAIRVWDGTSWIPIRDHESIDLRQACTWDEEGQFDGFKYSNQNPLNPLNDRVLSARANPEASWSFGHMEPRIFYHCTYAKNLSGIARRGLVPSELPNLGRPIKDNHRGIYLTEPGGLHFWFGMLTKWAVHDSRKPLRDGLVPVVLKAITSWDLIEDELGTRDARARAVVSPRKIPPSALRVWNGTGWIPVREHASLDLSASFYRDEDRARGFKRSSQNPLFPMFDAVLPARSNPSRHLADARPKLPRERSIDHAGSRKPVRQNGHARFTTLTDVYGKNGLPDEQEALWGCGDVDPDDSFEIKRVSVARAREWNAWEGTPFRVFMRRPADPEAVRRHMASMRSSGRAARPLVVRSTNCLGAPLAVLRLLDGYHSLVAAHRVGLQEIEFIDVSRPVRSTS